MLIFFKHKRKHIRLAGWLESKVGIARDRYSLIEETIDEVVESVASLLKVRKSVRLEEENTVARVDEEIETVELERILEWLKHGRLARHAFEKFTDAFFHLLIHGILELVIELLIMMGFFFGSQIQLPKSLHTLGFGSGSQLRVVRVQLVHLDTRVGDVRGHVGTAAATAAWLFVEPLTMRVGLVGEESENVTIHVDTQVAHGHHVHAQVKLTPAVGFQQQRSIDVLLNDPFAQVEHFVFARQHASLKVRFQLTSRIEYEYLRSFVGHARLEYELFRLVCRIFCILFERLFDLKAFIRNNLDIRIRDNK